MKRNLKIYTIFISIMFVLMSAAFTVIFIRENYPERIAVRMGWTDGKERKIDYAIKGWNNTLEKLDYDADIVFFGDSITANSDFRKYFPDKKIVTLGYSGDNLLGMQDRIPGLVAMNPEQVFVMGGINGLKSYTIDVGKSRYDTLLSMLKEELPGAQIYVLSVLPVSHEKEKRVCSNEVIDDFNVKIKELAEYYDCIYVDLNSLYEDEDGYMRKELTTDGVHLYLEAYDIWAEEIRKYIQ